MDTIIDKVQEVVKTETKKDVNQLSDLQKLIDTMKEMGMDKNSGYSLPLTDTIGRTYYSLNKQ